MNSDAHARAVSLVNIRRRGGFWAIIVDIYCKAQQLKMNHVYGSCAVVLDAVSVIVSLYGSMVIHLS